MLFVCGLDLFPRERCAILARRCLESNDVAVSQVRDRAVDGRRTAFPDADIVRNLIADAGSRLKIHQPQIALELRVIHDF